MWMQQQLITIMQHRKDVSIVVEKADQTITWSNPANITYGTLLSGTQLNATVTGSGTAGASAPGVLTYDPLSGSLLAAGNTYTACGMQHTDNYNAASKDVSIVC
jgi:hypothetical protein